MSQMIVKVPEKDRAPELCVKIMHELFSANTNSSSLAANMRRKIGIKLHDETHQLTAMRTLGILGILNPTQRTSNAVGGSRYYWTGPSPETAIAKAKA